MVLFISCKGKYNYVLIEGYCIGIYECLDMYIYMHCNMEMDIMKNKSCHLGFVIEGKITMYLYFMFSPSYIFYFKNFFAGNFYAR